MPKEQLRLLAGDVERLLDAGSNVAVGDGGLQKRSKALRDLSAKVPVLKQIADAIDLVTKAKPAEAGRKLLDLLLIVRQVRASLTSNGVEGELGAVPPSGPWATKSSVHDVTVLRDALLGTGEAGFEEIKRGLERKAFADLRLMQPILDGLANSAYAPRSDLIAQHVIPSLGPILLPELRQQFNLQGKSADARRLKAICKIAPEEGAALCRKVLAEGSKELKPVALEQLADLAPAEAERIGLEMLAQKPDKVFRAAALRGLARSTKDEALDALLKGIHDTHEVWYSARAGMTITPHSQATPRLQALLVDKMETWKTLQTQKEPKEAAATKGKAKAKGPTREQRVAEAKDEVRRVLEVMQGRRDAKSVPGLLPLLQHKDTDVRVWGINALAATREPKALAAIVPLIEDSKEAVWQAAIRSTIFLPPAQHFDTLAPLARNLHASKGAGVATQAIATLLMNPDAQPGEEDYYDDEADPIAGLGNLTQVAGLGNLAQAVSALANLGQALPMNFGQAPPMRTRHSAAGTYAWDPRWGPLLVQLLGEYEKAGKGSGMGKAYDRYGASLPQALVRVMGQEALPHLLRVLPVAIKAKDSSVLDALGSLRRKEAAAPIMEQLAAASSDWYLLYSFQTALEEIGDKSVLPRLREFRETLRASEKQRAVDSIISALERLPDST
jgi:HEAT repeat protein